MNQEIKITSREQEIVFTNFSSEDFDGKWNKKIYRLKTGKSYFLPFYLAEHFAKHLVDRELNNRAKNEIAELRRTDPRIDQKEIERRETSIIGNLVLRQELMDKCIEVTKPAETSFVSPREAPMREAPVLKTNQRSAEMVKDGRVNAGDLGTYNQPKEAPKSNEASFEGLEDSTA